MSGGSGVCECWRLTPEGVHPSRACPFYGVHWSEVASRTNQSVCPQPCEHLSQHDAREGRTCPEHPCTCPDQSNESET